MESMHTYILTIIINCLKFKDTDHQPPRNISSLPRIATGEVTGADPGFEKGGAQGVRGLAYTSFFAKFRGLRIWHEKGWACAPPPCDPPLWIRA